MSTSSKRRFADKDWVNFTVIQDIAGPVDQVEKPSKGTIFDSNYALETGLDVKELDTIPAELLDYFK